MECTFRCLLIVPLVAALVAVNSAAKPTYAQSSRDEGPRLLPQPPPHSSQQLDSPFFPMLEPGGVEPAQHLIGQDPEVRAPELHPPRIPPPSDNDFTAGSLRAYQSALLEQYGGDYRSVPLDVKAAYYEWAIRKYHLTAYNCVHPRTTLPDDPADSLNHHYGADVATWNGSLLAALSYKYAVTRDRRTLDLIAHLLKGMHFALQTTGEPGLLPRCVLRTDAPVADAKYPYKSPDGVLYFYRSDAAKGTYTQVIAGYAVMMMHVWADLPEDVRETARADLQLMVHHVVYHDYRLTERNGDRTEYGNMTPVVAGVSVPFNAQVAYMIVATGHFFPGPVDKYAKRIRREFERLRVKHHVYYENPVRNLVQPQKAAVTPFIKGMNDRNHLMTASHIGLLLDANAARAVGRPFDQRFLYQLGRTMYWTMQALETHNNAVCNFRWAGMLRDPQVFAAVAPGPTDRTRQQIDYVTAHAFEQLRRFHIDRFYYPGEKVETRTPQYVDVRKRHDSYLWKSGPYDRFELNGQPPTNTHTASIDYLHAYWLMRYYGLDRGLGGG